MTKALAWVAIIALIGSLGSTFVAIWLELDPKGDLLRLTELLLSWQVIAGGLAIGAGSTFKGEIKNWLNKVARS